MSYMQIHNKISETIKSTVLLTLLVLFGAFPGLAEVSLTVDYPRQVVQGNKFNVSYTLRNAEGSGFTAPEIGGATKLYGPSVSSSYSSQWVNGVSSSSSSQEYTMLYRAEKAGTYKVGAASVMVNGKRYTSKPFTIEILPPDKSVANGGQRQQQSVQFDNADTQTSDKKINSKDLFIRISMSKQNVYEQEAVVCTIKLYTKYQISQFMVNLQPSFNGFLIEELQIAQPDLSNVERIGGENYMVAELKKCILFPQKSGKLTITSGTYDVKVVQYDTYRTMFGTVRQPVEKSIQVKSNTATVNILPLPTPKPASFNGAVGNYTVSTQIKPQVLKTCEAATYSYIIKGSGNIKYLKAPEIGFPAQFDVYDPQNNVNAKPSGGTVSGTVSIDYTFIPQYVGKYEIAGTEFTYFNPATKKYVTLTTPKYDLTVAKGSGTPTSAKKGIEQKNKDILHIKKGDLNLKKTHSFLVDGFDYWLWYIVPTVLLIAILLYYRKSIKAHSNIQLMKTKRANKVAQKRLRQAKRYLNSGDSGKFYSETLNAIWGYLSDKLGIPVSELNKENIEAELLGYGVPKEQVSSVMAILDKCEFAQYAPELGESDMSTVYDEVNDVMNKLESTKRKKV